MMMTEKIKVIAFDADDTLWDCQGYFEEVENHLYRLIAPYCEDPKKELFKTESGNMADLGYGCKAFTISILETAMRIAGNDLSVTQLDELLQDCKRLLHLPATPLPGVEETLKELRDRIQESSLSPLTSHLSPLKLVCFTKGELQDQENKLRRSGLLKYFDDVEITSDKTQREFLALCEHQGIHPSELLMIGNSLKSDCAPALAIGAWAIHIPFHVTWQLEHFEDIDHERLIKVDKISDILKYI
ncbi:HAD family hydrolase [Prevotella communis]|uniref:HAD family hydrolase n=1 Tax=Prevotella communis TaxID=2913614 RepID=UPI001EDB76DA|nr:HAD family hydrolase [Prevotella communis]UKK56360.1 HAD hydrolase-like protein [Prevotella communis]UKK61889.1 HAD hydrolase-like protein [Prevotella communis]UKK64716.1 HAD hydrolase-like protein [Prevotella communis]